MLKWLHLMRFGLLYPAVKYNLQNSIVPAPCPQSDAAADAVGALLIPLPQPM